ncbi:MAG: HAD-IA family hydrolase [Planctomycetes bacterium]|nr:HAD-IA family hydrolase [Planctomycetota bacterium]MCH9723970.1 HAD-IA family hydrolase [Planctomycetota bacterium]MCH9778985.1 HAD-IA family hydrolase [Planctomycetota bacterium]MCH9791956.1 HAD-IA family hydrolase [Planctomycetota bacterium]
MMNCKAVIFDCDGVLVDSETLGNRVLAEMITEVGFPLSPEQAVQQFKGGKLADCLAVVEDQMGKKLPDDFATQVRAQMSDVFQSELQAILGVREALASIPVSKCVASNGPEEKMAQTLKITDLMHFFEGRIYSAYTLGVWKPEPDLYLYAAAQMGVHPEECVVVEDSHLGVQAAVAAGIPVLGYADHSSPEELEALGAKTFRFMHELPALLGFESGVS